MELVKIDFNKLIMFDKKETIDINLVLIGECDNITKQVECN